VNAFKKGLSLFRKETSYALICSALSVVIQKADDSISQLLLVNYRPKVKRCFLDWLIGVATFVNM